MSLAYSAASHSRSLRGDVFEGTFHLEQPRDCQQTPDCQLWKFEKVSRESSQDFQQWLRFDRSSRFKILLHWWTSPSRSCTAVRKDSIVSTCRYRYRGTVLCVCFLARVEYCVVITVLLKASQIAFRPPDPAPAAAPTAKVMHVSFSNTGRERTRDVQLSLHELQH